jgi:hypothetical protein
MTRKRHKKNLAKSSLPTFKHQARNLSPAAQIVADRIAIGGEDYLMQNFIRIMIDSAQLAELPEFTNFYLDSEKTTRVTELWLKKYKKRLAAAETKGQDAYEEVFDEMRIEVVAELATPTFRKEVDGRLQTLLDRLMLTNDLEKLEMVMLLKPLLSINSIPWGLCGLILAIYNRTMQRAMQEFEEDESVYDSVVEALKADGIDDLDILTILEHPDKLEQVGQKLFEAQPELRQRAEKQIWKMVEDFEDKLAQGNVDLSLFSEEELMLPFQRIQAQFGGPLTQAQPSEETREHTFDAILQAITEIMTPERYRRFREDVETTAKTWLQTRQKWAAALQSELGYLDGNEYEENKFVLAVFIGQIYRLGKEHKPTRKSKKRH